MKWSRLCLTLLLLWPSSASQKRSYGTEQSSVVRPPSGETSDEVIGMKTSSVLMRVLIMTRRENPLSSTNAAYNEMLDVPSGI